MSLHIYIHVGMEKQFLKKRLIEVEAVATTYIKLDSVIQSTFIVIIIKST